MHDEANNANTINLKTINGRLKNPDYLRNRSCFTRLCSKKVSGFQLLRSFLHDDRWLWRLNDIQALKAVRPEADKRMSTTWKKQTDKAAMM